MARKAHKNQPRRDRNQGRSPAPAANDRTLSPQRSFWSKNWLFAAALVVAVFLSYEPAWHAGFIWDDEQHLTENPCIVGPLGLKEIWTTNRARICPLVQTTFWFEHAAWGLAPMPYHLVNILLFALSAVALWQVLQRLGIPGAGFCAALWALHPVQVESAAWITELKNTQSGLFYLLAILFFTEFIAAERQEDRVLAHRWYGLSIVCGALALASKSSTVILPVVLVLCLWWLDGRWQWRRAWSVAPFVLLAAASSALSVWTQGQDIGGRAEWQRSWPERLAVAGKVVWFYLGKLAWPHPLIFVYPRWEVDTTSWLSYLPLAALILMLAVLFVGRNGWARALWFAFAYYVVALLPVLGLVNHYYIRYSYVGDHFQYLASMGIIALAGAGIARLLARVGLWRRASGDAICLALLLVLAVLTWRQCGMYENVETLYRTTFERNPQCWLAHTNLGLLLSGRGQYKEAIDEYQKALDIKPDLAEPHDNIGLALAKLGRVPEAIEHYRKAIENNPRYVEARYNLAVTLAGAGQTSEAIAQLRKALETRPDYAEARNNLALLLANQGKLDEAIFQYERALQSNPKYAKARNNLGLAYSARGRTDEAISQYRMAIEIAPNLAEAHYNLGVDLAARGEIAEAIVHYRRALASNPNYAKAHYRLGLALAASRQVDAAIVEYEKALAIKPDFADARRRLEAIRRRTQ